MGLIKYQKGKITGKDEEDPPPDEERPQNGHSKDLHCPHDVPVNACKLCAARPSTEPK